MINEIAFKSRETALEVAKILLDEDYVVMLSSEEDLTIVNWQWSDMSDRNDVVFMRIDEYEDELEQMCKECKKEDGCCECKD